MGKRALYAGSFDPLTNGHIDVIKRAAMLFDELVVCVVENPDKKSLFDVVERKHMIEKACISMPEVIVDSFVGLLADYVNNNSIDVVVRGLRNSVDFEYELQMAHINEQLYDHNTQTVFLMTEPELSYISSGMIKEVASLGGNIDSWVTEDIKQSVYSKYGRNK